MFNFHEELHDYEHLIYMMLTIDSSSFSKACPVVMTTQVQCKPEYSTETLKTNQSSLIT